MNNSKFPIEVSFTRGKTGSKALVETTVFSHVPKRRKKNWKKVKPSNTEMNIANEGKDIYNLCCGKYRIVTETSKSNGKYFSFTRTLTIEEQY